MSRAGDVDLTIRHAQPGDAAALAALICELGYPTTAPEMAVRLEKISCDPQYRTFVAVEAGKVRGMIGTFAYHTFEHNDLGGRILALVVAKNARRRSIGRRLVEAAEREFAQSKVTRIAVNARFEREDAHAFYEGLGYRRNGLRFVKRLR